MTRTPKVSDSPHPDHPEHNVGASVVIDKRPELADLRALGPFFVQAGAMGA